MSGGSMTITSRVLGAASIGKLETLLSGLTIFGADAHDAVMALIDDHVDVAPVLAFFAAARRGIDRHTRLSAHEVDMIDHHIGCIESVLCLEPDERSRAAMARFDAYGRWTSREAAPQTTEGARP